MPVDITEHPNFNAQRAKFASDKAAAVAAGDDLAIAKAEAEWANATSTMTREMYERADVQREREVRIARIRAENPAAPDVIFEGTDLDQMERAAKAVQAQAAPRSGGSWSPPPGSGTSGAPGEPRPEDMTPIEREQARQKEMAELRRKVARRGTYGEGARDDIDRLQQLSLAPLSDPAALEGVRAQQAVDLAAARAAGAPQR